MVLRIYPLFRLIDFIKGKLFQQKSNRQTRMPMIDNNKSIKCCEMDEERKQCSFRRKDHILYFVHNLKHLPKQYTQLDTNRLTLLVNKGFQMSSLFSEKI
jgi:hypothetical protein